MGAIGTRKLDNDKKTLSQFQNLCRIQCTCEEIAGVFEVSESSLRRWVKENYNQPFEKVYKMYASGGRASLRRHQFAQSENNPIMAIWLGKQILGQREVVDVHNLIDNEDDPLTKAVKNTFKGAKKKSVSKPVDDEDDEDIDDE
jgi:hypothetical protein